MFLSTVLAAPGVTQRSDIVNPALGNLMNSFGGLGGGSKYVSALLSLGITALLVVGGVYFVIQLLLGGVKWIQSGGDKAKLEEARGTLTTALVGIIILFSAWAIISFISATFGINIFLFNIPTLGQ